MTSKIFVFRLTKLHIHGRKTRRKIIFQILFSCYTSKFLNIIIFRIVNGFSFTILGHNYRQNKISTRNFRKINPSAPRIHRNFTICYIICSKLQRVYSDEGAFLRRRVALGRRNSHANARETAWTDDARVGVKLGKAYICGLFRLLDATIYHCAMVPLRSVGFSAKNLPVGVDSDRKPLGNCIYQKNVHFLIPFRRVFGSIRRIPSFILRICDFVQRNLRFIQRTLSFTQRTCDFHRRRIPFAAR